jgi:hypothetical protein
MISKLLHDYIKFRAEKENITKEVYIKKLLKRKK